MSAAVEVRVTRGSIFSSTPGNRRPFSNYYEAEASDGRRFTNTSIVTLRDVLKRAYPGGVVIVETWKAAS